MELLPILRLRLRAAIQPAIRQPLRQAAEFHQPGPIVIDPVVLIVPTELRIQTRPHFRHRRRQVQVKPVLQVAYLRFELLLGCPPFQLEPFRAALAAVMSKTKEIERPRRPLAQTLAFTSGKAAKP